MADTEYHPTKWINTSALESGLEGFMSSWAMVSKRKQTPLNIPNLKSDKMSIMIFTISNIKERRNLNSCQNTQYGKLASFNKNNCNKVSRNGFYQHGNLGSSLV